MAIDRGFTIPIGVDSSQAIAGINAVIKKLQDGLVSVEDAVKGVASVLNEEYEIRNVIRTSVDDKGLRQAEALQEKYLKTSEQIVREAKKAIQVEAGSVANLKGRLSAEAQSLNNIRKYNQEIGTSGAILLTVNQRWAEQNQRVKELQQQLRIANANNPFARIGAEADLGGLLRIGKKLTDIVNIFQSINIVVGQAVAFVSQFATALNKIQQFELVFKGIGAGASGASQALGESSRIALGLGADLNVVREGFQKLTPAVLAAGGTIGDTSAIIEALSSRFALFGMSADQSSRVMNGVIQAFGKGKLMAEELTQQISEADPAFRTDLAAAIGVTSAQLGEMVKAGEITSAKLIEFIPLIGKSSILFGQLGTTATSAAEAFGKSGVTIDRIRTQFSNLNQINLIALGEQFAPLLQALLVVEGAVIDFVTEIRKLEVFEALASSINFTAQTLAQLTKVVLGATVVIIKIVEPVFALFNALVEGATAVDNWVNSVAGIKPIAIAVGLAITASLIAPLTTLATSTIGVAVGAIARLSLSLKGLSASGFAALSPSVLGVINNLKGFGSAISGGFLGIVGKAVESLTGLKVATKGAATVAAASTASYLPPAEAIAGLKNQMSGTVSAAGNAANAMGATGSAAAKAAPGVTTLGMSVKALLTTMLPLAIIIGSVAYVYDAFKRGNEIASESSKKLGEELGKLRKEALELKAELPKVGSDAEQFARKIEVALKAPDTRNSWQKLLDTIKNTNDASRMDVINTASAFNREFNKIKTDAKSLESEFSRLKLGQLDDASIQKLESQVSNMIDQYDLLIVNAKQAREELFAKAQEGGFFSKEAEELRAFDADIQRFYQRRNELAQQAKESGLTITVGVEIQKNNLKQEIEGIKGQIETLEMDTAKVSMDSSDYDLAQYKIKELGTLSDALQGKSVKLNVDVNYESAKTNLESISQIQDAISQKIQAQGQYYDSIYGVLKAQSDYRVQKLEEIGASEQAIEQEKEKGRQIEIQAAQKRLEGLAAAQEIESQSLAIKQQLAMLDAQSALSKAKLAVAANQVLQSETESALLKAQQSGDQKEIESLTQKLELLKQTQTINQQEVTNAQTRITALGQINQLEQEALGLKQAAEQNNVKAELASKGVAVNISTAATNTQELNTQTQNVTGQFENQKSAIQEISNSSMGSYTKAVENNKSAWDGVIGIVGNVADRILGLPQPKFENPEPIEVTANEDSLSTLSDDISEAGEEGAKNINEYLNSGLTSSEGIAKSGMEGAIGKGATEAEKMKGSLDVGVQKAKALYETLSKLDSLNPTVKVTLVGVNSRWTGGPVRAGQQYQVNELGKEAFLSATGRLSMINKPRNAMWRPTSSGTVIPAHIAAGLDIPSTGIKVSTETVSGVSRAASRANNNAGIGRAIANALLTSGIMQSNRNLSATQSEQAVQLGKLTHAVNRLSDKNWDVRVNVQDSGAASLINRVNRML